MFRTIQIPAVDFSIVGCVENLLVAVSVHICHDGCIVGSGEDRSIQGNNATGICGDLRPVKALGEIDVAGAVQVQDEGREILCAALIGITVVDHDLGSIDNHTGAGKFHGAVAVQVSGHDAAVGAREDVAFFSGFVGGVDLSQTDGKTDTIVTSGVFCASGFKAVILTDGEALPGQALIYTAGGHDIRAI